MKLSIVIVNYNVKYFLKQCLASVMQSDRRLADGERLELEVWVVDNDSVDGSQEMVRSEFGEVHLIENHENVGFAKANNQALEQLTAHEAVDGELILLLNPDTLVESDTLVKCADYMRQHPDVGGCCVKMVDGQGRYLKESKRGFPTPEAAFFKMTGLTRLFPHSRRVAAYYMGHLPDDEINEIEIMPGAFLMFSREVYDKIGGLDESYFMYGEDIDFSWRIHMAGYKNVYLPTTHIIHYKGESTKKGSMNYVYTFYNAMSIFVKRYFTGGGARLYSGLLRVAIWLRATLAWTGRIARRLALPVADFLAAYGGFVALKGLWARYWADNINYYPAEYTRIIIPIYILVLMCCSWLSGGYDKPLRKGRIVKGMLLIGMVLLLAFYSLLDEQQRYSRMLLLSGSLWTLLSTLAIRQVLGWLKVPGYSKKEGTRTLVVGSQEECRRVEQLYASLGMPSGKVATFTDTDLHRLAERVRIDRIEEVVFCASDVDLQSIIEYMTQNHTAGVEYKIAPAEGDFIIGSNSIMSPDDAYLDDLDTILTPSGQRAKRLFDIATSLLALLLSPILVWFQKDKRRFFTDCWQVLTGQLTWVGYTGKAGVFLPSAIVPNADAALASRLMLRYMRHRRAGTDVAILLRYWNCL